MNKLAVFIKNDRKSKVMAQDEYCEQLGITPPTLSKLENGGSVNIYTLRKLAFYYKKDKVELYKMMVEDENENNK